MVLDTSILLTPGYQGKGVHAKKDYYFYLHEVLLTLKEVMVRKRALGAKKYHFYLHEVLLRPIKVRGELIARGSRWKHSRNLEQAWSRESRWH